MESLFTDLELTEEGRIKVQDKMKELMEVCQIYRLPMYACVAVDNSGDTTEYESNVYNPASHNIQLKDDRIRKHLLIADGFDVVPKRNIVSVDMSSIL